MSLYFVQAERGGVPLPEDGIDYPDLATARAEIARTAVARLHDRVRDGTAKVTIHVTDAEGRELFTATATVAVSPLA